MVDESQPEIQGNQRSQHNGVQQYYMHGLCFDSLWKYQTRSRTGRKSWARLDLGPDAYPWAKRDDPEGAGWCVRCCASVLRQRPVPLTHMQHWPIPTGEPASVVAALHALLPWFKIDLQLGASHDFVNEAANTIGAGGGVLARLERHHELRQIPPCWVWVVGMEVKPASLSASNDPPVSMLLVGRELSPPWASGYGAKAVSLDSQAWIVRSVDGQAWCSSFHSMIYLQRS